MTHWSLPQLANEVVVVPIPAGDLVDITNAATQGFGGLILFGAHSWPGLTAALTHAQTLSASGWQMMVMTDEEGGGVQRLTDLWPNLPWARTQGTWSPSTITATLAATGRAMLAAGVNTDLAPVLDVDGATVQPGARNPDGLRSFSGSPSRVSSAGVAALRGLTTAGVTAVVKHFPGLGGASANTDYGPAHTLPWATEQVRGLAPFAAAIKAGAPAVMMSNASVPGLTTLPAGLSPAVVGVLRGRLGFTGLIMTDSLSAGAISALHLSVPQAAVRALAAGADQVLFSPPRAPITPVGAALDVRRALVAAVAHHQLARATLVAAAAQVLAQRNAVSCPPVTSTSTG